MLKSIIDSGGWLSCPVSIFGQVGLVSVRSHGLKLFTISSIHALESHLTYQTRVQCSHSAGNDCDGKRQARNRIELYLGPASCGALPSLLWRASGQARFEALSAGSTCLIFSAAFLLRLLLTVLSRIPTTLLTPQYWFLCLRHFSCSLFTVAFCLILQPA